MGRTDNKEISFEKAMERLGEIVARLESGEAPLDESLKIFEEGASLIAECQRRLDEAEQKVVRLRKGQDGAPEEMPFGEDNAD